MKVEVAVNADGVGNDDGLGMAEEARDVLGELVEGDRIDIGGEDLISENFGGLTFSKSPTRFRIDPSSLSCAPRTLTSFHTADIASARVPSFIAMISARGGRMRNFSG